MSSPLCTHPDFEAVVRVNRLEDVGRFVADVQVRCAACGVRFRWLGFEMGLHPTEPRVSVDHFELRAPIEPDGHLTSLMAGGETGFPSIHIRRTDPK
jgi:hypothetical protein